VARWPDSWIGPYWEPRDIWIGVYWTVAMGNGRFPGDEPEPESHDIYICVVPCFPIRLRWFLPD
jgi:hypothetical protein